MPPPPVIVNDTMTNLDFQNDLNVIEFDV